MSHDQQLAAGVALVLGLACGGEDPDPTPGISAEPLLPWKVGNTWTYKVTDNGVVSTKVTNVGELEPVGIGPNKDVLAHHVVTTKSDGLDKTESWQAVEGDRVVRYRETSFSAKTGQPTLDEVWSPNKLRVDPSAERTTVGATWQEQYEETKIPAGAAAMTETVVDTWFVDKLEDVTVPGVGTKTAVVLRKVSRTGNVKRYWFVPGVGKVREEGGQLEELVEFTVQ